MNKRKKKQLIVFFNQKLEKWAKEREGEDWYLKMKLTNLMNEKVSFGSNDFWQRVVGYILIIAEKTNVSSRQVIENLFEKKDSDDWIFTFQDLKK